MNNLHKISPTVHNIPKHILTDMMLANIWAIQENLIDGTKIRISSVFGEPTIPEEITEDTFSPIQYNHPYDPVWDQWYWETHRLHEWRTHGSPMPDLTDIEYGPFEP